MKKLYIGGKKYGMLTTIDFAYKKGGHQYWNCICDCGKECVRNMSSVIRGDTQSCGCIPVGGQTHGLSRTRFFRIYDSILGRCYRAYNGGYSNYGAKGIICLRKTFTEFKDNMYESYLKHVEKYGEKDTTIDRIDNNGNYCKENCRWATRSEQDNNKSTNIMITYKGKTQSLKLRCTELGIINYDKVKSRIRRHGRSFEKAIENVF